MQPARTANATTRLMAHCAEIDDLLARIAQARADHFGASPDATDWGHVGTAAEIAARLREIARFANAA